MKIFQQFTQFALKGIALGLGIISVIAIAYAFTTWSSGNSPQASPVSGNVNLSVLPTPPVCNGSNKALQWSGSNWGCADIQSGSSIVCIGCVIGSCEGGYRSGNSCCGVNPTCIPHAK